MPRRFFEGVLYHVYDRTAGGERMFEDEREERRLARLVDPYSVSRLARAAQRARSDGAFRTRMDELDRRLVIRAHDQGMTDGRTWH